MKSQYSEEVQALKDNLKKGIQDQVIALIDKRHACVLYLHRTRQVWSDFYKNFREYKTTFYVQTSNYHFSMYYSDWKITLTEDVTQAQMYTAEEAVDVAKCLPFDTTIVWRADHRTRCSECDSVSESGFDDKHKYVHFCVNEKCTLFRGHDPIKSTV